MQADDGSIRERLNRLVDVLRVEDEFSRGQAEAVDAKTNQLFSWTDRFVVAVLAIQFMFLIILALIFRHFPSSWSILLVSGCAGFSVFLTTARSGHIVTRHMMALSQMGLAILSLQIVPSYVSMPFFLCGSLISLAFYLDWKLIVSASSVWFLMRAITLLLSSASISLRWIPLEALSLILFDSILLFSCFCRLKTLESSAQKEAEQQVLIHQAYHDPLTGLGNRLKMNELLNSTDLISKGGNMECGILLVDLDYFKEVNDSYGHQVGDEVLREAARRLQSVIREVDTVVRLGGDEFAVILQSVVDANLAATIAQRIVSIIGKPIWIGRQSIGIGASVGICIRDSNFSSSTEELIRCADLALYKAKAMGRGTYVMFDQAMQMREARELSLERRLRVAVSKQLFDVHYQPICSIDSRLIGFEALLRWNDEVHGQVPPNVFIPLAEKANLIGSLGRWVLSQACREAVFWRAVGRPELGVAVNVSGTQLDDPDFANFVSQTLKDTHLPPEALTLEITESTLIGYKGQTFETFQTLSRLGVQLAIDDFGTGFSCLSYLRQLPVQAVKIDRAFIKDLGSSPSARILIESVVRMAHLLNLRTVAEGIENSEELGIVSAVGCDAVQGFHFSEAVPAEQALVLVAQKVTPQEKRIGPRLYRRTGTD